MSELSRRFGEIDIYLFDQLLRGRIVPGMRILDAGCGGGRNLIYFLESPAGEFEIFGVDADPKAIASVRRLARHVAPENFRVEPVEEMSFPDAFFDVVISSAVLHFAQTTDRFRRMLEGSWRKLKPGGLFFCRLASSIGIEEQIVHIADRRYLLPDGSERYLADEALLSEMQSRLGARPIDPLKTTVVQNLRAMSTWILRKNN
ncbi:MAG TPA: class I SAM-dependent methyltransferase [Bryobacteraceae bacterium]|jgi:2-polyprenyl-3-methyl-5-hydroxy-6-metoxy-1,4-benzoquinol methylase|nr:class I SAM-dependent methyltransferase [Bryobacteraceae bacterium]